MEDSGEDVEPEIITNFRGQPDLSALEKSGPLPWRAAQVWEKPASFRNCYAA